MSKRDFENFNDLSMLELFRMEVETQSATLTDGLLALERDPTAAGRLPELMRAAHSLKGASRIVGRQSAVTIAHAMEDCLASAQKGKIGLSDRNIDQLLYGTDLLRRIAELADETLVAWEAEHQVDIGRLSAALSSVPEATGTPPPRSVSELESAPNSILSPLDGPGVSEAPSRAALQPEDAGTFSAPSDRVLRVTAQNLDRLMGMAGEVLVSARWVDAFAREMIRLKRLQHELGDILDGLHDSSVWTSLNERAESRFIDLKNHTEYCRQSVAQRLEELELFGRRFASLSTRLYEEVLECRMRPFSDGIIGLPRMVRDVARTLGKKVKLDVIGEATTVDRDILERLKAPLDHLLRNALDHGIESPTERGRLGKPEEGKVQLIARHSAGALLIAVADDGSGISLDAVRQVVLQRKLASPETVQRLSEAELLEFLFLPGFTLKHTVTEISGRGVGLDVVRTMVRELGGRVRLFAQQGGGTRFQLELPLTLSVIRALLVEIAGEPYAFPLGRIERVVKVSGERIESLSGRPHFALENRQIGLVTAHQVLELGNFQASGTDLSVVILGTGVTHYGLVVDRLLGERELVVRPLDRRLGKVRNITAASLMSDGTPLLIIDVEDMIQSIENLVSGQRLSPVGAQDDSEVRKRRRRILVVDDSLTVRELERKLLTSRGYAVDIAVDGMDGWNAVRTTPYDLVITDVDMPRLDGIELIKLIRGDHRLKSLAVIVVSYKDRQEDRVRGLEAGADYYLTKGSFDDESLTHAVADLVGGAEA